MKIEGRVEGGRFHCDVAIWAIAMREFEGRPVVVEIDRKRSVRSNNANARYWTVLNYLARHHLNLKRPGLLPLNKDQVHDLLVTAFVGSEETELGHVPMPTRTLDSKQFHHFTEQVELWLQEKGYPTEGVAIEDSIAEATA